MEWFVILTVLTESGQLRGEARVVPVEGLATRGQLYDYMRRQIASSHESVRTVYFSVEANRLGEPDYFTGT